jgi:hypothetical protein
MHFNLDKCEVIHITVTQKQRITQYYMIIYCYTSRSIIFHFYGDVTIAGEGLHNLPYLWEELVIPTKSKYFGINVSNNLSLKWDL